MELWGGLRPIASRVALDAIALSALTIASVTSCKTTFNATMLLASCIATLSTAGLTNRWPITFPMLPILFLQGLRRIVSESRWATGVITGLSILLLLLAVALSLLFPAVELPPINGPYNVGVADFFLPVRGSPPNGTASSPIAGVCSSDDSITPGHVTVRLLYPTHDETGSVPYLHPETALEFCRQSMRFGAPAALKSHGWFLHNWRLAGLKARRNAKLVPSESKPKLPIIFFSHGLGGDATVYSYQTLALAAHGNLVVSITHQDGSAPVVQTVDGSTRTFDYSVGKLALDGNHVEYVRTRRARTDRRVKEFLAAIDAFLELDTSQSSTDIVSSLSLKDRLDKDDISFVGHSFGGATVLTAAARRPVKSVIAHDPAVDWMPDDSRRALFATHLLEGLNCSYGGGTGGFLVGAGRDTTGSAKESFLQDTGMLIMFSEQWRNQEWGGSHILEELHRHGRLGSDGASDFHIIKYSNHMEYSDTSMLTPTWLARGVGATGKRNPCHTAKEIEELTRNYLQRSRLRRVSS